MTGVSVRGADEIDKLVKSIRQHADSKALKKDLFQGLNRETKTVRNELIDVIPAALPRRGGLAAEIQGTTRSRTSARSGKFAGVTMRFTNSRHDIRTLTGQRLRHPVFGNRNAWVEQTAGVDPSLFKERFQQQKPELVRVVQQVLEDVARKVTS